MPKGIYMAGNFRVCRVPHAKSASESRALEFVFSRRKHVAGDINTFHQANFLSRGNRGKYRRRGIATSGGMWILIGECHFLIIE